jgi:hypothetical protein
MIYISNNKLRPLLSLLREQGHFFVLLSVNPNVNYVSFYAIASDNLNKQKEKRFECINKIPAKIRKKNLKEIIAFDDADAILSVEQLFRFCLETDKNDTIAIRRQKFSDDGKLLWADKYNSTYFIENSKFKTKLTTNFKETL